ncbi:MAG TPA: fumarylacetoacetate hydrolase family protein [Terriglobia bacterium]|nr:fumarylacetoacetate hydrolase family protein [Terriglobia bacterium]
MKFINMSRPGSGEIHLGCHWDSAYLDITQALPGMPSTIEDVLRTEGGLDSLESQLEQLRKTSKDLRAFLVQPQDAILKAPILHPQKLIGIGLNYRDHAEESKVAIPKSPLLFGMYANAIIGPEAAIVIPPATSQVDYEAELAVVIGSRALRVSPEDAVNYVAGYTIVNDVSARDLQFGEKQWTRGKSIDTFAPMGPCLTTRTELGSGAGLSIQLRLNGETLQKSTTSNLIFDVPALVSHISQTMTLEPGDVISTGTPSGVGYVRKPPIFLKQGDVVEIEIEGIGVLRNPVVHLG